MYIVFKRIGLKKAVWTGRVAENSSNGGDSQPPAPTVRVTTPARQLLISSSLQCHIVSLEKQIWVNLWQSSNRSCDIGLPDPWTGNRALYLSNSYFWPSSCIGIFTWGWLFAKMVLEIMSAPLWIHFWQVFPEFSPPLALHCLQVLYTPVGFCPASSPSSSYSQY